MLISGPGLALLFAVEVCGVVCLWVWPDRRMLTRAAMLATAGGTLLALVLSASGDAPPDWRHVGTGVAAAFGASVWRDHGRASTPR